MLDAALPKKPLLCTIDDLHDMLMAGENTLWVAARGRTFIAAFVTYVVTYPRAKSVKAWLMAGTEMREWAQPFFETMMRHARKNSCTLVEGCGRRGWQKIYPGLTDLGPVMLTLEVAA